MKKVSLFVMVLALAFGFTSCKKGGGGSDFGNIETPRTSSIPDEMVGRWAIVGISGSTVYDIPAGSTYNTSEVFLGYQINKDGTIREDGYASTYSYGSSTWAKWSAVGSVQIGNDGISFHRARGSYTSSRNGSPTQFGSNEVYPNKSVYYPYFELGTDGRGQEALVLTSEDGVTHVFVKQ